jgi:hypothetical protein
VFPYAAYLRVYEPVTAFPEPSRTLWTAYADSRRRPRRIHALGAEHLQAKYRLVASPPEVVPEHESGDAYVRRSQNMIYVCPWETRLRSWLALSRFKEATPSQLSESYVPPPVMRRVEEDFERWKMTGRPLRPHILSSNWHVPPVWFVPFTARERCLILGESKARVHEAPKGAPTLGEPTGRSPKVTAVARTLIYVTTMADARARIDAAMPVVARQDIARDLSAGEVGTLRRWLTSFHPRALVELDYGGLVHLLDDNALDADQSVAEVGVALAAMARREPELSVAMIGRLRSRWRLIKALESAS